ncbi:MULTISPECIES: apolipoprotein N-acyltransferase [unclassified Treponema]|uniref:apolipoprotein N-acyltransferase n=1 Tax=unclassified Treponema TaxID=2638727 RepID=UPI0020A373F9|nr:MULTISPECIES: apolipoprotein N-acyltransferase [unclassified Treponema]UTC66076.1 apolipoprotein N-acyltransferase [Treponema sp. OMZ 789]UTC68806.1 apolipoprotein N-acyltransferase [Treponema sp. OMZ 790]UTC71534.1 apolipoprotein N-acyltransferase [Treponema sp. OMZ 791]
MHFFLFFLGIFISSTLFSLGIPNEFVNFGSAFAGFSGLTLVYYTLLNCGSYKKAALLYGIFVSSVHVMSSFWLAFFEDFAIFTLGASTLAYFFMAMPFGFLLYHGLKKNKNLRPFYFASVWLLWEFAKSTGFLAYPWGTAPMICFNLKPFIQFIDTTGVWGLSFAVPFIAACIGEILQAFAFSADSKTFFKSIKEIKKLIVFTFLMTLIINLYGIKILKTQITPKTYLNTLIVQQNTDPWDNSQFEENMKISQFLTRKAALSSDKKPDLVVWSESSLIFPYNNNMDFYDFVPYDAPFTGFLTETGSPILLGSPYVNGDKHYNAAYLLSPKGDILGIYSKIQLVAFAEYMPFTDNPIIAKFFDKLVGFSSGWNPGTEYTVFDIENSEGKNIKFTAPICFEDAFPAICRDLHNKGSEVLINITNDSWSKTKSAEYQHFVVAHFRAIELRTALVRSTNSGYSAVVDPKGKILADLPLFEEASLCTEVPIYEHTKTFYASYKDWFPLMIFLIFIFNMMSEFRKRC